MIFFFMKGCIYVHMCVCGPTVVCFISVTHSLRQLFPDIRQETAVIVCYNVLELNFSTNAEA